jgi:hypothetical protein
MRFADEAQPGNLNEMATRSTKACDFDKIRNRVET